MTVNQIFENAGARKTVWTKRGDQVSKREVSTVSSVKPRVKIEAIKEGHKQ